MRMAAGLEIDIQRGTVCARSGRAKRNDFSVRSTCSAMVPLSNYSAALDDHGAHHGIGARQTSSLGG